MTTTKRTRGAGTLRLANGILYARYYDARGKRHEESTGYGEIDRAKAEAFLLRRVRATAAPTYVEPSMRKVKFEEILALAMRDAARKRNRTAAKLGTPEHPGPIARALLDRFAGWPALTITSEIIEHWVDERIAAGVAVATQNRRLAALRRALRLAVDAGLVPKAPAIALRPEDNARQGFLDAGDLDALLGHLRQREAVVADIVECAFLTLLRRENVLGLTWPMLDLTITDGHVVGGEMKIPGSATKNKKPLLLPLAGRLLDLIDRRHQGRTTSPFVFHRDGQRIGKFRAPWRQATVAIGRPGLLLHDLRRSGARVLIREGVPEDVVMKLGGWKSRAMLARYNVVDTTDLAAAQAAMNAAFAAPRKVVPLRKVQG